MSTESTYKRPKLQGKPRHPYFQFTDGHFSPLELVDWLVHFRVLGIPAAIIFREVQGNKPYSLWRVGIQACTYPNRTALKPTDLIIEEVHDFLKVAYAPHDPK